MTDRRRPLLPGHLERALHQLAESRAHAERDLATLAWRAADEIAACLPADRAAVWILEDEGRRLLCAGFRDRARGGLDRGTRIGIDVVRGLLDRLGGGPFVPPQEPARELGLEEVLRRNPRSRADSSLIVPIDTGDRVAGLIALGWNGRRAVDDGDVAFVRAVGRLLEDARAATDGSDPARRLPAA